MRRKFIALFRKIADVIEKTGKPIYAPNVPPPVSSKRHRVALCFSGQIRSLKEGYEYILKNIIEPNRNDCDMDVFVHTWFNFDEIGKTNVSAGGARVKSSLTQSALMDIYKHYNPQKLLAEKQIRFDEKNYHERKPDKIVPWYSLSKNYSLKKSFALKKEHEAQNNFTYDFVMSLRFDLGISNPVYFRGLDPNKVTVSEKGYFAGEGMDVTHAVVGGKHADTYGLFFDYLDQYYNEGIRFCDEPMMQRHLEFHKIPFVRTPDMNDYVLLR